METTNTTRADGGVYQIFCATYCRWNLEGETACRQIARDTIRTLRAGGRLVMVKLDGKKVSWRI